LFNLLSSPPLQLSVGEQVVNSHPTLTIHVLSQLSNEAAAFRPSACTHWNSFDYELQGMLCPGFDLALS
jgi:hypothetical protein